MHSPTKNRSQGWKWRIKTAAMAKTLLFFPFPSPLYHAHARAPRLLAAQYYFLGKLDRGRQESQRPDPAARTNPVCKYCIKLSYWGPTFGYEHQCQRRN
ncbi:hypothetical protein HU200_012571 [Digitaria exilis]|uniref:Uncharacterized protein n=1 Tax=Digitaria exilis TaxID=1010633 RepID=A0A835FF06_9POAL|nr:hypothetical protein HU200_012571 [Digitaria exilis]